MNGIIRVHPQPSLLKIPLRSRSFRVKAESGSYDAVIVGGGISGLCTAKVLATDHSTSVKSFLVTEAKDRVGGNITTRTNDEGYLWEDGPNTFTPSDPVLKIAVEKSNLFERKMFDPR